MSRILRGAEVEEWFKDFARKAGILKEDHFKMEETIRLFNEQLNHRLNRARKFISTDYVDGIEWIDRAINKQPLPNISNRVKSEFANRLADLVMGTDAVLQVKNILSQDIRIAVDVTTNDDKILDKVRKVRGQSASEEENNKNQNIPAVRSSLGIDKHLVILLERTKGKLPSHEKLLDVIYSFAEANSRTRSLDLTNLDPKDRFNWRQEYEADPARMWQRYSQGINAAASTIVAVESAKRALRANHTPEAVFQMLTQDPQYRQYIRNDRGDRTRADVHARALLNKAEIDLIQEEERRSPEKDNQVEKEIEGPLL